MLTEGKEEQEDWIAALNEAQGLSVTNTERFSEKLGFMGGCLLDCGCLWVPLWGCGASFIHSFGCVASNEKKPKAIGDYGWLCSGLRVVVGTMVGAWGPR